MEPASSTPQSSSEAAVPYGHTCATCAKSKQKCTSRGGGKCVRCHRRGLECRPSLRVRKHGAKQALTLQKSQIEGKLDDLVSLLRARNAIPQVAPVRHATPADLSSEAITSTDWSSNTTAGQDYSPPSSAVQLSSVEGSAPHRDADLSISCGSPLPSDGNEWDQSHENEVLDAFRTHYLRHFPFTYLAPEVSAQHLRCHRPFLWMNIEAICTKSSSEREILGQQIRQEFARKFIIDLERDLDLLQGVLTYLGWSLYHFSGKPFHQRFASAANALVADMQLDGTPKSARTMNHTTNQIHANGCPASSTTERNNEERRAILATFIISSTISNFLKTDVVRWTPQVEDSLDSLAGQPEYRQDEILVGIAQIRRFVEEVTQVTWKQADDGNLSFAVLSFKSLRNRFELLRSSLQPQLLSEETIQLYLHDASLQLHEIVITHGNAVGLSAGLPHINYLKLWEGLETARSHLKPQPLSRTRIESFYVCVKDVKTIILFTLSTIDDPDFDQETVLYSNALDASQVLRDALELFERVAAESDSAGDSEGLNLFRKSAETVRATIHKWDATLRRIRGATQQTTEYQATTGSDPGAGLPSDVGEASWSYGPVFPEESNWLADLFSF
ncbi:Zn(II)2Cys6 transcription factor [Apiospora arundinis]